MSTKFLTIWMLLWILLLMAGCGRVECKPFYNTYQEYTVQNNTLIPDATIQEGLDVWNDAGYFFKVGVPLPGTTFVRVEILDPEQSKVLLGEAVAAYAIFWLAPGANADVAAHELGHILGISAHTDEVANPGCHVMNASVCGALELTPSDYQLLQKFSCN